MSWMQGFLVRACRWPWKAPRATATVQLARVKETVICVGCVEDGSILDRVLEAGSYDVSFIASSADAYAQIVRTLPDRVILCMRSDDEVSLRLLSMLTLDPRTNAIPVITCVASVTAGRDEAIDDEGTGGHVIAGHRLVMH
jgi:CheY-like chemotaxis protein